MSILPLHKAVPPVQESNPPSDDVLLARFLGGDREAFADLMARHAPTVRRLVARRVRGVEESKDLTQKVFLRAYEAAPRALRSAGPGSFRPWLLRIALNLSSNHLRDVARWLGLAPLLSSPIIESEQGEGAERAEQLQRLREEVSRLPRRQREVFSLRIDAELSFSEVARTLGLTENNAKVHFHHALCRLRAALRQVEGDRS